jgi:ActR/RegA family two-component response regulator
VKTALLIDDDLGFLFWLADVLSEAGYQAYSAERFAEAAWLLAEIHGGVDLAIVNLRLPEAVSVVKLLGSSPRPPEIMVLGAVEPGAAQPGVTAWLCQPDTQDGGALSAWRKALRKRLAGEGDGMPPRRQAVDRPF